LNVADFVAPGRIEFRTDATRPVPGPNEVLVGVKFCGICGSDMHMFRNNAYRESLVRSTPEGYQVPGHEFAGTIVELGPNVEAWAVGDRVVGVTGHGGGMAQFVTVPVNAFQLAHIPGSLAFDVAATTEPLADALQMVRKAEIRDGESVVVFGVGIIGLGVIQAIRAKRIACKHLIAVDVAQVRLDKALQLGASAVINARLEDPRSAIGALCGVAEDYRGWSARVDVVVDCAGYIRNMPGPPPLETALQVIALRGGRIICFGGFEDRVLLDLSPIIQKQPTILGSNGYAAEELREALALMHDGSVDRSSLISHRFGLHDVSQAFATQGAPQAVKVLLAP